MPRFFFHVHDGVRKRDEVGTELPDWQAARLEAIRLSGEIIQSEAARLAHGEDWRVELTDHTGETLFQMTFMVIPGPAMKARRVS